MGILEVIDIGWEMLYIHFEITFSIPQLPYMGVFFNKYYATKKDFFNKRRTRGT